MIFKSHTNLNKTNIDKTDNAISESIEHISINKDDTRVVALVLKSLALKTHHKARDKSNLADQFYIYRIFNERNVSILMIKYKASHKLSQNEIIIDLEFKIQSERDVINKNDKSFNLLTHVFVS
jgi:hypothetical protein